MEEILVNEEGYQQYLEELERVKSELQENASVGGEVLKEAVGDGWHDNFAYDEVMRAERDIVNKIQRMLEKQKYLKVIKETERKENIVNLNDNLEILFIYDENDQEKEKIKLTGKYIPLNDEHLEIKEISLNSPLGKAIYKKKIGETVSYTVGKLEIKVKILGKI